jgi:peptidoglycan/xylan/chitin deacetylase (PgdA/CDA1 family)
MFNGCSYSMVQVDLDGLDAVLDCYGSQLDEGETDVIYTDGVVQLLELLREYDLKATFFMIGKDAEIPYKRRVIERIIAEGHELANHTYSHPLSFARLSPEEQIIEIEKCNEVISSISGKSPRGFRAPGYAITSSVVNCLENLQFTYDASVFPCAFSWLIRAWQSLFSASRFEKDKYGSTMHAIAPCLAYQPDREAVHRRSSEKRDIYEIPVSTMPIVRLPFHGSYVMVLSKLSPRMALLYWKAGFKWYLQQNRPYTFVIHPLELTSIACDARLTAQIGYNVKNVEKLKIYREIFATLKNDTEAITTEHFVRKLRAGNSI